MMGVFFLISGTGKTGTSWLSEALNHPYAGITCLDEGKLMEGSKVRYALNQINILHSGWNKVAAKLPWLDCVKDTILAKDPWLAACEYELEHGIGPRYDSYFNKMRDLQSKYEVVGDSHSWEARFIPDVNRRMKIDKVIHLVRNGIPNVHALHTLNYDLFKTNQIFIRQLEYYIDLFGGSCSTAWQYWCFWWAINAQVPDWLKENLVDTEIEVFRLEDLVSDPSYLIGMLESLVPGSSNKVANLLELMGNNSDRDFSGDRSVKQLWDLWSIEQKLEFNRICGPTMEHYGYQLP